MVYAGSKSKLAILLSQLKSFEKPKSELEQYPTDSEYGAEVLWYAYLSGEIEGKVIVDLGAGTGLLGIGALVMGAKKVFLVEKDPDAAMVIRQNLEFIDEKCGESLSNAAVIVEKDIDLVDERCDVVIQNPPFGIQGAKHADKRFLEKAFKLGKIVYSFHTVESKPLLQAISKDFGFAIKGYWEFNWPLKQTMAFHKKRIQRIKIGCWRMEKLP